MQNINLSQVFLWCFDDDDDDDDYDDGKLNSNQIVLHLFAPVTRWPVTSTSLCLKSSKVSFEHLETKYSECSSIIKEFNENLWWQFLWLAHKIMCIMNSINISSIVLMHKQMVHKKISYVSPHDMTKYFINLK